jgi:hypothetical protein
MARGFCVLLLKYLCLEKYVSIAEESKTGKIIDSDMKQMKNHYFLFTVLSPFQS